MDNSNFHNALLESFQKVVKNPEEFLESNKTLADDLKSSLKTIYDFTKNEEIKTIKSNALPELIVQNFDLEQIWQQIELQNESLLVRSLANVSKHIVGKDRLVFTNLVKDVNLQAEKEADFEKNVEDQMDVDDDNELESNDDVDRDNNGNEDEMENSEEESVNNDQTQSFTSKKSVVDDDFFKLDEMERFLNAEEKKLNDPGDSGNDSEEDSENEEGISVDLFEAGDSSDEEENKVKTAKFKDFFVQKDEPAKKEKRNKFFEEMEEDNDDDEEFDENEPKSSYELRQERLNREIDELEDNAVAEKPWQLKGEVTSEKRPQNSLLAEDLHFDSTTRPACIITEKTNLLLEDIIKQRIKDSVFDSPERKAKPVETPLEYKKKMLLDQEKSKESLAQIYEKEYLDQKAALDPDSAEKEEEEPPLHKEINTMMINLFHKLDSLSNFHFTPKPAMPELKIVSNLPAISMEEVAPVASTDAALLAPEEIRNKTKGDIIGKGERTDTDKNRERRKKKLKQKVHVKEKQKRDALINKTKPGLGNKYSKEKLKRTLEAVTKDKNVDKMVESSRKVKSSSAFFTELEEQVKTQIKSKTSTKSKSKKTMDAKKLKL